MAASLCLTPKHLLVAVGIERRINVEEVNASIGQLLELL
jgi:hypothetical protein